MKENLTEEIEIPQGVEAKLADSVLTVKGDKGELSRQLKFPKITLKTENGKITLSSRKTTKREKKVLYTFKSHIKNMLKGVQEPWVYKLKVCSGHFPITAEVKDNQFVVKNFLGEKIPRKSKIPENVDVKVSGAEITVTSPDKEAAGKTASNFELLTRVTDKDLRRYQDGIYITVKAGEKI